MCRNHTSCSIAAALNTSPATSRSFPRQTCASKRGQWQAGGQVGGWGRSWVRHLNQHVAGGAKARDVRPTVLARGEMWEEGRGACSVCYPRHSPTNKHHPHSCRCPCPATPAPCLATHPCLTWATMPQCILIAPIANSTTTRARLRWVSTGITRAWAMAVRFYCLVPWFRGMKKSQAACKGACVSLHTSCLTAIPSIHTCKILPTNSPHLCTRRS